MQEPWVLVTTKYGLKGGARVVEEKEIHVEEEVAHFHYLPVFPGNFRFCSENARS